MRKQKLTVKYDGKDLLDIVDIITDVNRGVGPGWENNLANNVSGGADFYSNRKKSRKVTISYVLIGTTSEIYNKTLELEDFINKTKPCPLIFTDAPNIVWQAIIDGDQNFGQAQNLGKGTLVFIVPSGYAESVNMQVENNLVKNQDGSYTMTLENNGNLPTFPTFKIKNTVENGAVGIVSENGVMQLGNMEEVDKAPAAASKVLLDCSDSNSFSPFVNTSTTHPIDPQTNTNGLLQWYLDGMRYKTLGTGANWHGGMSVATLSETAQNFYCYLNLFAWLASFSQIGDIQIMLTDSNNKLVMAYGLVKSNPASSEMLAKFWIGGNNPREWKNHTFTPDNSKDRDAMFNKDAGNADMVKDGGNLGFYWMGKRETIYVPELANIQVSKVFVFVGTYGSHTNVDFITNLSLRKFIFQKNFTVMKDIPNRYPKNTELLVDMENGMIEKNGIKANEEKVNGSTFFEIPKGESKINFVPSSWFSGLLSVEASWKERL